MNTVKMLVVLCCLAVLAGCAKNTKVDPASVTPTTSPVASAAAAVPTEAVAVENIPSAAGSGDRDRQGPGASTASSGGAMETIYFDFDSFTLTPEGREKLQRNARRFLAEPSTRITIAGHTDERGSDAYNLALGEKRAKAALDYLVNLGVAGERVTIISYGEERPAEAGQQEESWSKNRRAEFM